MHDDNETHYKQVNYWIPISANTCPGFEGPQSYISGALTTTLSWYVSLCACFSIQSDIACVDATSCKMSGKT